MQLLPFTFQFTYLLWNAKFHDFFVQDSATFYKRFTWCFSVAWWMVGTTSSYCGWLGCRWRRKCCCVAKSCEAASRILWQVNSTNECCLAVKKGYILGTFHLLHCVPLLKLVLNQVKLETWSYKLLLLEFEINGIANEWNSWLVLLVLADWWRRGKTDMYSSAVCNWLTCRQCLLILHSTCKNGSSYVFWKNLFVWFWGLIVVANCSTVWSSFRFMCALILSVTDNMLSLWEREIHYHTSVNCTCSLFIYFISWYLLTLFSGSWGNTLQGSWTLQTVNVVGLAWTHTIHGWDLRRIYSLLRYSLT